ncbi:hypothetical protein GON26_14485 [Flavobacterium sp. GA093]|uniref:Uncharacterized protein n=1 Tax=Flavobacterium hydrocarbonoxydans TaxID=2683249 RepID=A0A6I4NN73_9FLAO|nr:hypothetical protein [Flavobacterium hydrocarbonoxydans]MWB95573.1 hypothetical protein [Flavobacterium hydrocarbonoxydans]
MKIEFRKLQNLFFLIFCVVLMTNCGTEDAINQQQINETTKINEAKIWFIKYQSENKFYYKFENQSYDWDNASVEILENESSAIVVPVVDKNKMENYRGNKVLYLYPLEDKKNFETTLYELLPTAESLSEQNSTKDLTNFDGYIIAWNLERGFIESTKFEKSASIATVSREEIQSKKVIDNSSKMVPDPPAASYCLGDVILCNDYKNNGGGYDGNGYVYYVNSGVGYSSGGYAGSYFNSSHGSGGGGSGITAPTPAQIIDALTGKAKCIFEKLKNSSSGFESAIKKFDGEFTVSHLKLTINNSLDANVYGITKPPVNYVTEVQFDNTKLGTLSDLGAATVFAHEIIHAEIFRKMLSAAQRGTLNSKTPQEQIALVNSLKDNFPGLYDYYEKRWKPTWNHEMMASHYRSTIADIIQQFDNKRLPRSTYEAVAWLGLGKLDTNITTIAWDNLSAEQKTATTKLINEHFYKGPSNCN